MLQNTTSFLAPQGFQLSIQILPKVGFYSQRCNIPGITLPNAVQSTRFSDVPIPGDKMTWDNFSIDFMIDKDMANYLSIWNWIVNLGFPNDSTQYNKELSSSPGVLQILGGGNNVVKSLIFEDLIPISLTTLEFSSVESSVVYFQGTAEFMYSTYKIE